MHPRIQEVLTVLDDARESLSKTIAAIPPALHKLRPAEDRWSVAEVVEHVGMVETRIVQMLKEKIDAARSAGLAQEHDTTSVAPMLDVAAVVSRSKPIAASEASQPRGGLSTEEGLKVLTDRREELRSTIASADGLALGTVEISHPRLGNMNAYQWMLFLAGHEARHTDQIREAAQILNAR